MKKILFLLFDTKEKNSYIYTEDSIISSFLSPYELIQSWCMDYGSTVEGRTEVIKRRIYAPYKTPVYIHSNLFLFPTQSCSHKEALWFNYYAIQSVFPRDYGCAVCFNKITLLCKESYRTVKKQYQRCQDYDDYLKYYTYPSSDAYTVPGGKDNAQMECNVKLYTTRSGR